MAFIKKCINVYIKKIIKLINNDCLPIFMLLYIMPAYLMLFTALFNVVCLHNAFIVFVVLCSHRFFYYERAMCSGEISLKNNHCYLYKNKPLLL